MWTKTTILSVASGLVLVAGAANAQISIDQMAPASAYDAGVLQASDGGLDSALWQGVSAVRATALIENIDTNAKGFARDLIRSALLSGGVPPQANNNAEREAYLAARLNAILKLGDLEGFDTIAAQSGLNPNSPIFKKASVERALFGGDKTRVCTLTDTVTTERKLPYWAKLRAYCHYTRGEIPAAELTADLLGRSGHKDKAFFALLGKLTGSRPELTTIKLITPLDIAMLREVKAADKTEISDIEIKSAPPAFYMNLVRDETQPANYRLSVLLQAAPAMKPQDIGMVLGGLADAPTQLDKLPEKWDVVTWGGAFLALRQSQDMEISAGLISAILKHSDHYHLFPEISRALEAEINVIPIEIQAKTDPETFARAAVVRKDTNTLRGLFQAIEKDNPARGRIALASDALGNGFVLGDLGVDIETRLALTGKSNAHKKARAVRDTFIAIAMGANLSDTAEQVLRKTKLKGHKINPGVLLALQSAAKRGGKAEIALRAGAIWSLEDNIFTGGYRSDDMAAFLSALTSAGMYGQAGQLAAYDILSYD